MSGEQNFLDVKIMGREYRVACMPEERDALLAAVDMVDGKMRDIAQRTRSTIAERVAVMAALNIAHEHLVEPVAIDDHRKRSVESKPWEHGWMPCWHPSSNWTSRSVAG